MGEPELARVKKVLEREAREAAAEVFDEMAEHGHDGHAWHCRDTAAKLRAGKCDDTSWFKIALHVLETRDSTAIIDRARAGKVAG
ncbi:MAG: hypothetical protein ABGX08_02660 [Citromicrobium sp.]